MVKQIVKDILFLGQKSEEATKNDIETVSKETGLLIEKVRELYNNM